MKIEGSLGDWAENLVQTRRWLGGFPCYLVNVHGVMCTDTNVPRKHCNESKCSTAIQMEKFLLGW